MTGEENDQLEKRSSSAAMAGETSGNPGDGGNPAGDSAARTCSKSKRAQIILDQSQHAKEPMTVTDRKQELI